MYVSCNSEGHLCNHCCSRCNKYYIFQKCVFVALVIQHAMSMLPTAICDLSGSIIFFYIISSLAQFLKNEATENTLYVLIFFTNLYEKFLILRRTRRDMIKDVYWSSHKLPVTLV
jgi:hypothetical protein